MSQFSIFEQVVRKIVTETVPIQVVEGVVLSVDKTAVTCTVECENAPTLFNVRLKAVSESSSTGVIIYPKQKSYVLCAIINNDSTNAYVLDSAEIESVVIDDGSNGGLAITPKLVENLNKNNSILQAILKVITGTPIFETGNGIASSLQQALSSAVAGKQLGDFSSIENQKIKH